MCWRRPNVPVRGLPDPILVHYSGSDDGMDRVTYIVCLHGRVPERYKLWSLNEQGVREVHPFARIRLLDILGQILSRLPSSIREDAVFLRRLKIA